MTRRAAAPHLDDAAVLDYLDGRLPAVRRRAAEAHLASPCAECRERLRAWGELLERLHAPLPADVPAWAHARARAAFEPEAPSRRTPALIERLARLLFDSWSAPLPAAVRRAAGDVRRMRFQVGQGDLELECEREDTARAALRGVLRVADPELHAVTVTSGRETLRAQPDAHGAFAVTGVPRGRARLHVRGPSARWRTRVIEL